MFHNIIWCHSGGPCDTMTLGHHRCAATYQSSLSQQPALFYQCIYASLGLSELTIDKYMYWTMVQWNQAIWNSAQVYRNSCPEEIHFPKKMNVSHITNHIPLRYSVNSQKLCLQFIPGLAGQLSDSWFVCLPTDLQSPRWHRFLNRNMGFHIPVWLP